MASTYSGIIFFLGNPIFFYNTLPGWVRLLERGFGLNVESLALKAKRLFCFVVIIPQCIPLGGIILLVVSYNVEDYFIVVIIPQCIPLGGIILLAVSYNVEDYSAVYISLTMEDYSALYPTPW